MVESLLRFVNDVTRILNKHIPSFNVFSLKVLRDDMFNHHGGIL